MKRITGEVAVRSFFGENFKNISIKGKLINNEITDIFTEGF